ncbi:MAG: type II secretion system protein [Spartobacteria bacterium]|nr:type II secretion system protein [Spartobacteria bacterium]
MRAKCLNEKDGFTLVEIMIVVAIMGLLMMIALPSFNMARRRTQRNKCQYNQRLIFDQMNVWCMVENESCDSDTFPNLCAVRDALVPANTAERFIKTRHVFSCPGNPNQAVQHDYNLVRNGRQIVNVLCGIHPAEHNP